MKHMIARTCPALVGSGLRPCRQASAWRGASIALVFSGVALLSAGVVGAQTGDTATTPSKQATKTTAAPKTTVAKKTVSPTVQPLTIPTDAVAKPDGGYSYTDKAGKKWIYTKSAFGVSKIEDKGDAAANPFASPSANQVIRSTDNGDTVKFQRQTPFGVAVWEKKKSEMTDEERHVFESQQPKPYVAQQPE
jgi:hypothetical protein